MQGFSYPYQFLTADGNVAQINKNYLHATPETFIHIGSQKKKRLLGTQ